MSELQEVSESSTENIEMLIRFVTAAGGIPPPWQYPDQTNRLVAQPMYPCLRRLTRRITACENLVGFSTAQPDLFKRHQLLPVRDLKLLIRDYTVRPRTLHVSMNGLRY